MVGSGIILILLGVVRITFVPVERRLATPAQPTNQNPVVSA
jgi:hypothetical protein